MKPHISLVSWRLKTIFYSNFAESGPVLNMISTPTDDHTLKTSWLPPHVSNGSITSYYMKVTDLQSGTYITDLNISNTSYIHQNLSEYSICAI